MPKNHLVEKGVFSVGCNYWASYAGTNMWHDWRPDVVDGDLRELADAGLEIMRVFPLWPDFQPLTLLRGCSGTPFEYRFGEEPLPDDETGRDGVSQIMLDRFASLLDLCEKHKLKTIVALVTGWMSGRMFVPPALEGRNVITDPEAIMWETRLVRRIVSTFKGHPAILAWELGNECNCMGPADREQAWAWTAAITHTAKSIDPTTPFISGMHGLKLERRASWRIEDQAEITDLLTTHPYAYFTPHCDRDPIDTLSSILHATAESRFNADIGGKPCFAEELGTLGDIFGDEDAVANRVRCNLFSLWAHDCRSLLWWCAYDQGHLAHAPYDWNAVERELGLLKQRGHPKKVLGEFGEFRRFIESLPFPLPPRMTNAVCVLTEGLGDSWAVAYSSFILGVQAGLDFEFGDGRRPLKEAPLYLLPSISGSQSLSRRRWGELLDHVRSGATLYLSCDTAIVSSFEEITGLRVTTRERRSTGVAEIVFPDFALRVESQFRLNLKPTRATVLAAEPDGNPAFTVADYGKGKVYFLSAAIEAALAKKKLDGFDADHPLCWRVYELLKMHTVKNRLIGKTISSLGVTEHPVETKCRIVVAINYSPRPIDTFLTIGKGWRLSRVFRGQVTQKSDELLACLVEPNAAAVFEIRP